MSDNESQFLQLAKQYEVLKEQLKSTGEQLDAVMKTLGEGTFLQDPDTSIVYKIVIPTGHFVNYRSIGYDRTSKEGESRGTLAKKEAEAQGFILRK